MITIEFINTLDPFIVHYLVHTLTSNARGYRKVISVSKQNPLFDKIEII